MPKTTPWTAHPKVASALESLLAHYQVLSCSPGSSRMDTLTRFMAGPPELRTQFSNAHTAFAAHPHHPEALAALARVTWVAFAEPSAYLAEEIDDLGLTEDFGMPNAGGFGRLWCRHVTDAAWIIWTLACHHDRRMMHLTLDNEWLEDLR